MSPFYDAAGFAYFKRLLMGSTIKPVVRQEIDGTCWAASLAELTGIDYDILSGLGECLAPAFTQKKDGCFSLKRVNGAKDDMVYLTDWNKALAGSGVTLLLSKSWPGKKSIMCIIDMLTMAAHAVIVDDGGILNDNTTEGDGLSGTHRQEIEDACNIQVAGYIYMREK